MNNKVYYGEYTLSHWIDLMLKGNIKLPIYQRLFVWEEDKVHELIRAFKKNEFVPPVTIGSFIEASGKVNLILDGQQRLTSILLSYLGIFPDKKSFKNISEKFADENDSFDEEANSIDNILDWKFDILIKKGNTKELILNQIVEGNYKQMDLGLDNDFFGNTFLGFSYLVPYTSNENQQQKYYSTVFRNINIRGEILLAQESREALYYLDKDLLEFFKPNFLKEFYVSINKSKSKLDFVRYLSILSQHFKDGSSSAIAKGFKSYMEGYYETYISEVVEDKTSNLFGKFTNIFPNKKFSEKFNRLKTTIQELNIPNEVSSIIDLDIYFFGLIYFVVFVNKDLDLHRTNNLMPRLKDEIKRLRGNEDYSRAPNNLGNLRSRISKSIEIYEEFAK